LQNQPLRQLYGVVREDVLASPKAQREFFNRLVPDQIDLGPNPKTFEWMRGRVADGSGDAAPRELIHLVGQARAVQMQMLERGEAEPDGEQIFSRQALRDALPEVSRVRLHQTLYAEYPELKDYVAGLEGEKADQTVETLAAIWRLTTEEAEGIAIQLAEIGFFVRRGRNSPEFWVPFLYRPALALVQGKAE
jgi:hypothetical protein